MTDMFDCDDKGQLMAYLYDEGDVSSRRRVVDHLRICAACAAEVAGLTSVRQDLQSSVVPTADLAFAAVRQMMTAAAAPVAASATVLRSAKWWTGGSTPAWLQAAAALLMVATGLSIANLQVRYDATGLKVSTGWMPPSSPAVVATAAPPAAVTVAAARTPATPEWAPALAALETQLRQEMQASRPAGGVATTAAAPRIGPDAATVRRLMTLIDESERRQDRELALRLTQFTRDVEVQRRSDLVKIDRGFGQFEGRTGAEFARQKQMLDYVMRVSAQPQQ